MVLVLEVVLVLDVVLVVVLVMVLVLVLVLVPVLVLVMTAMVLNAVVRRRTLMRTKSNPSRAPPTLSVCSWTVSTLVFLLLLHVHRVDQFFLVPLSTLMGLPSLLPHKRALRTCNARLAAVLPQKVTTAVPRMRVPGQQQARDCPVHSRSRP